MKKSIWVFIFLFSIPCLANAEKNYFSCPKIITCQNDPDRQHVPGPFYYSNTECKIEAGTETAWKHFKINDNYTPTTNLPMKEWVTLSFKGAFLPENGKFNSPLNRPRCLYGLYDPYVPYFVSIISSTGKNYSPQNKENWKIIKDQYQHDLLVCDSDADKCGMVTE